MTPQQPYQPVTIDAVMALLRDGAMRRFRIDIEADSTIAGDESQEKRDRTEFITATTQFVTAWAPILQEQPALVKMAGDMLLFGVRAFRVGRELEETIEETMDKIEDAASQPKPPTPQDQADQIKLETEKVKAKAEIDKAHIERSKAQFDADHQQRMAEHQMNMAQQSSMAEQNKAATQNAGSEQVLKQIADALSQHQQAIQQQQQAMAEMAAKNQEQTQQLMQAIVQQHQTSQNLMSAANVGDKIAQAMTRPRKIIRDETGAIGGVE